MLLRVEYDFVVVVGFVVVDCGGWVIMRIGVGVGVFGIEGVSFICGGVGGGFFCVFVVEFWCFCERVWWLVEVCEIVDGVVEWWVVCDCWFDYEREVVSFL